MEPEDFYPQQTQDLLNYGSALVAKLEEQKADDGKLDISEVIMTLISTAPDGIQAMMGSDEIPSEIKRMSAEQKESSLMDATDTIRRLFELFWEPK